MRVVEEGGRIPLFNKQFSDGEMIDLHESEVPFASVRLGFAVVIEGINDLDFVEYIVAEFIGREEKAYEQILPALRDAGAAEQLSYPDRSELDRRSDDILEAMSDDPSEVTSVESLYVALRGIRELWRSTTDESNLGTILSINPKASLTSTHIVDDVDVNGRMLLTLGHDPAHPHLHYGHPVLFLQSGSIIPTMGLTSWVTVAKWGAIVYTTVRGMFTTAPDAAAYFVDALRAEASKKARPLPRLDRLTPQDETDLANAERVIVLLHGLFSTDAGTFDGLLECWDDYVANKAGGNDQGVYWVGWPHDTLASVNQNARALKMKLLKTLGASNVPVLFVCHSRGGVLGRDIYQELIGETGWDQRLKGCITYGSPHNGVKIAGNPLKRAGGYALLGYATKSLKAFDALMVYLHHKKRIDGIDDLQPKGNNVSEFLEMLEQSENLLPDRQPELLAVGGDLSLAKQPTGGKLKQKLRKLMQWGNQAVVGSSRHDTVVDTDSSIPVGASGPGPIPVDHFSYFEFGNADADIGLNAGIDQIRSKFGLTP